MKILVRSTNWVGDAVMSIPALEVIRRRWPDAEIAILGRPSVVGLYRGQNFLDRLIILDQGGQDAMARELRRERFDCALLFQNAFAAAWLAWRAGIPERIGYARDGRGVLLTHPIPLPQVGEVPAHESYYYLELLRRAGWIECLPLVKEIRLRVEPAARQRAETLLRGAGARAGSPRVALSAGAAYGSAKRWEADRFAALADRLIADFGAVVILFGTASESEIAERISSRMRQRPVNLVGQSRIGDLPALFASCHLFVGNDSGAMHVAAAVGLPVVAVFGPTDPEETAPVTPRRSLVRHQPSCSPCFLRHCPVDHRCMFRIEIDAVYAAASPWLERGLRG